MALDHLSKEAAMMDLDRLIEARQDIDDAPLGLDQAEMLARYEGLYTGLISDVLREFVLLAQALPGSIVPLRPERTVAGVAFTVKSAPNVQISGEMEVRTRMLTELTADAFVVGDIDGVVVVPRALAVRVLERAEELRRSEEKIFSWVANGDTVQQITARGGYF